MFFFFNFSKFKYTPRRIVKDKKLDVAKGEVAIGGFLASIISTVCGGGEFKIF